IASSTDKAMQGWTDGSTVDVLNEMLRFTFVIIVRVLLGADARIDLDEMLEQFAIVVQMTERNRTPYLDRLLARLPLRSNSRYSAAVDHLRSMLRDAIGPAGSRDLDRPDVLSTMLQTQRNPGPVGDLSDRQIEDEMLALLLAGHETTSNALTWTWYLLSEHPDAEARLHKELESVLAGRTPTAADLPRLPYTRMVLLGALRLYPPVWVISRRPTIDLEIGGYRVPAWSSVNTSPYLVQRDPRYFTDPARFQPERWLPERVLERPRYSFFPFSGGERLCMGQ